MFQNSLNKKIKKILMKLFSLHTDQIYGSKTTFFAILIMFTRAHPLATQHYSPQVQNTSLNNVPYSNGVFDKQNGHNMIYSQVSGNGSPKIVGKLPNNNNNNPMPTQPDATNISGIGPASDLKINAISEKLASILGNEQGQDDYHKANELLMNYGILTPSAAGDTFEMGLPDQNYILNRIYSALKSYVKIKGWIRSLITNTRINMDKNENLIRSIVNQAKHLHKEYLIVQNKLYVQHPKDIQEEYEREKRELLKPVHRMYEKFKSYVNWRKAIDEGVPTEY